jgi:hypothetical protein
MADMKNNPEIEELEDGEELVEVVDLDGELFEKLDELEHNGETYFALIPYEEYDDDSAPESQEEFAEFGILKRVEEDGEFFLETIDDEDEQDLIGKLFEERFDAMLASE